MVRVHLLSQCQPAGLAGLANHIPRKDCKNLLINVKTANVSEISLLSMIIRNTTPNATRNGYESSNKIISHNKANAVYFAFKSLYLPNFLTKFPTEPEVNLSCRRLCLLHYGRFLKKVIISPYFSLSDGENCPKMHFFGIKLSRLAFSGGKI